MEARYEEGLSIRTYTSQTIKKAWPLGWPLRYKCILSYLFENVKRYGTEEHWYTQSQFWSKGKGWLTHVKGSTEKKDSCTYHKPNVPES